MLPETPERGDAGARPHQDAGGRGVLRQLEVWGAVRAKKSQLIFFGGAGGRLPEFIMEALSRLAPPVGAVSASVQQRPAWTPKGQRGSPERGPPSFAPPPCRKRLHSPTPEAKGGFRGQPRTAKRSPIIIIFAVCSPLRFVGVSVIPPPQILLFKGWWGGVKETFLDLSGSKGTTQPLRHCRARRPLTRSRYGPEKSQWQDGGG